MINNNSIFIQVYPLTFQKRRLGAFTPDLSTVSAIAAVVCTDGTDDKNGCRKDFHT